MAIINLGWNCYYDVSLTNAIQIIGLLVRNECYASDTARLNPLCYMAVRHGRL